MVPRRHRPRPDLRGRVRLRIPVQGLEGRVAKEEEGETQGKKKYFLQKETAIFTCYFSSFVVTLVRLPV